MTTPATVDELLALLARGAGVYDEPDVDGLAHALQCGAALRASQPGDVELAIAGLVHDVADIAYPGDHGDHARRGAALVEPLLGPRVARLVGAHVAAKRYLVATDPVYRTRLSAVSARTLSAQGGPMSDTEVREFEAHPDHRLAVRLREIDDRGKVPGLVVPGLDRYRAELLAVAECAGSSGT